MAAESATSARESCRADGVLDAALMTAGKPGGQSAPVGHRAVGEIGADHPGQAPRAGLGGLGAAIGGRMLVGILGESAQHAKQVGRGREQLVHQRHPPAGERRLARQRHHRRAGQPDIDELARGEPVPVGHGLGAPDDRRRAGQMSVVVLPRSTSTPSPSRRAASVAVASQFADATSSATTDSGGRRSRAHRPRPRAPDRPGGCKGLEQHRDAGAAIGEQVDELAGHGHPDRANRLHGRRGLGERCLQPVEPAPERAGKSGRPRPLAVRRRLRRLEMGAAEIEAGDQLGHRIVSPARASKPELCGGPSMAAFELIPVIDLIGGVVVHARAGDRDHYRPLEGSLIATRPEPTAVVEGLLGLFPFPALYIADLDAIRKRGDNTRRSSHCATAFRPCACGSTQALPASAPAAASWVRTSAISCLAARARPTCGCSTASAPIPGWSSRSTSRASGALGAEALFRDPARWPPRVIAMTLARVGSGGGPDLDRLRTLRALSPATRLYAAGGVRGADDIRALIALGCAGVLVASALHDGRLGRGELTALLGPGAS